ncbi:MAG: class I adenylate-forming enzyme family protein [Novosphingobium sp.]
MASELDADLNAAMDALTAPGGPLETSSLHRFGHDLPVMKQAPPHLPALFDHFCAQHGDLPFLVDGDVRLTFAQVHALAREAASGLIVRHSVRQGDRVGIAARNSASWIVAYMAVLMAGGCATLLNGWWTAEEMAGAITLAECKLILADAPRAARIAALRHDAALVTFGHGDPRTGLEALMGTSEALLPTLTPDDLASILFTSGSTGLCKGAASDHRGVVHGTMSYAAQTLMTFKYLSDRGEAPTGQPCALVAVPLFHVTGEVVLLLQSFVLGRKLVLLEKWDAAEAMRQIEAERVTYFVGVPLMSFEIARHPDRGRYDLSSCVTFAAGGAPRPVDHVHAIRKALPHAYPILGYGLTETNGVGCGNFNQNYMAKPGSTGPASRPLVEVAILDDAGAALPQGQTGEVAIRSIANFTGYWRNPEATAAAMTADGFFRSGDLGYLDPDGYLFIVDRKKDIIIRGGENIAASEVEAALYGHPGIAEASVFGLPDERLGEVPVAVFVARPGADLTDADLRAFLETHLAPFKIPVRFWRETASLPRLGTEKVDKRALKARFAAQWLQP